MIDEITEAWGHWGASKTHHGGGIWLRYPPLPDV